MPNEIDYFQVGIGVVLEHVSTGKVLILKRSSEYYGDDYWDIVGGRLENNESVIECIYREVFEETGIENVKIVKILDARRLDKFPNYEDMVLITYWCQSENQKIKLSMEHTQAKWIDVEDVNDFKLAIEIKSIVQLFSSVRQSMFDTDTTMN